MLSGYTWVQWALAWEATPGAHTIEVRATDGTGEVQTEQRTAPAPDGASGHHTIRVNVNLTEVAERQRCSGLGKSNRQPASHSERWLPWAGMPPASFSMRARWSRFQVMNVVLRLVKSFSGPPEPGSR